MQFNTKLNFGNIVWTFQLPIGVTSHQIDGAGVEYFGITPKILYRMNNGKIIDEDDCGIQWWNSKKEAEDAIRNILTPPKSKCQYPNFKSPCDIGRKPQPRDDDDAPDETLDAVFNKFFEPKKQEPQSECCGKCSQYKDHQSIEDVLADWPKEPAGFQTGNEPKSPTTNRSPSDVAQKESCVKKLQPRTLTNKDREKINEEIDKYLKESKGFTTDLNRFYDELFDEK